MGNPSQNRRNYANRVRITTMRVVVLGAGYAGLTVIRRLERLLPETVELLLVDESDTHLLVHELHRVVRKPAIAETITLSLADIVSQAEIRQGRVTNVDTDEKLITIETAETGASNETTGNDETGASNKTTETDANDGSEEDTETDANDKTTETLTYDVAAVCLGSETNFYELPGVEANAIPLKRLSHAEQIRERAFEIPEGNVVIGGAGLSGVQVAGELAALSREEVLALDITLVEAEDRVAPGFNETFADALERELESVGISIETGVAVESATESEVTLADGRTLPADLFIWTGGIQGPSALGGERPSVDSELELAEGTFVVGDAGNVVDADGTAVPASAQTAVGQARVAAKNIAERVERETGDGVTIPDRYRYESPGWVVSVGDGAVAHIGPVVVNGEPARAAKAAIGAGHLGSVGAIGRASALVASELGLPGADCARGPKSLDNVLASLPTDPASPGQFGYPLANFAFGLTKSVTGDEPIDLTR